MERVKNLRRESYNEDGAEMPRLLPSVFAHIAQPRYHNDLQSA